jgi:fucose 4-O-acetylase-like acetyltransferase
MKNSYLNISKKRLVIVDLLQGIAMVWVIIGHHLFDFMPTIYHSIHYYIYSFHMPFFIFISSFLIAYSYKELSYRTYIYRKFHKFFLPYVLVGIIVIALSALKEGFKIIPSNLLYLIFSPKQSEATFLWYIYLLFIFTAVRRNFTTA